MVAVRSEPARREASGRAARSTREDTEAPRPASQHHEHTRYAAAGHTVSTGRKKRVSGAGIREQSHRRRRLPASPVHGARARVAVKSGPGGKRYQPIGWARAGRALRAMRPCAAVHLEQIGGHCGHNGRRRDEGAGCAPLPATAAAVRTGRIAGATEKALAPASRPRSAMLATAARIFRSACRGRNVADSQFSKAEVLRSSQKFSKVLRSSQKFVDRCASLAYLSYLILLN